MNSSHQEQWVHTHLIIVTRTVLSLHLLGIQGIAHAKSSQAKLTLEKTQLCDFHLNKAIQTYILR
jgi:hypothetical protein